MSTKNLARTVIEGGRTRGNRADRRQSNASVRAAVHMYREKLRDGEAWWSLSPPVRRQVYRWFDDRLGPVSRWMDRHCGRPWSEVRDEILRLFDTRTLAGRHIVYDHMLREVWEHAEPIPSGSYRYRVDERGILRGVPRRRREWTRTWLTGKEAVEVCSLADDRKIRQRGSHYFWLEAVSAVVHTKRGYVVRQQTRYRQSHRLTDKERERFLRLSAIARATLLVPLAGDTG